MSDDKNQSIQLDEIFAMFEIIERRISRLESSFDMHRKAEHTTNVNIYNIVRRLRELQKILSRLDDMESDITFLFHLTHGGDNFCGNCEHCVSCPDGLYRCDITNLELDPDSASCIRFKCPQIPKSDAEICKACSDKDTPRCFTCSHFPF